MKFFKLTIAFVILMTFSFAKVDLNSASKDELMSLTGVGAAKAEAIIEYRKHKQFTSIDELKNVKGFGPKIFDKLKDDVEVNKGNEKVQELEQKAKSELLSDKIEDKKEEIMKEAKETKEEVKEESKMEEE